MSTIKKGYAKARIEVAQAKKDWAALSEEVRDRFVRDLAARPSVESLAKLIKVWPECLARSFGPSSESLLMLIAESDREDCVAFFLGDKGKRIDAFQKDVNGRTALARLNREKAPKIWHLLVAYMGDQLRLQEKQGGYSPNQDLSRAINKNNYEETYVIAKAFPGIAFPRNRRHRWIEWAEEHGKKRAASALNEVLADDLAKHIQEGLRRPPTTAIGRLEEFFGFHPKP
jgi:hypothetical protein